MLTALEKRSLERALVQAGLDKRDAVTAVSIANRHFYTAYDARRHELLTVMQQMPSRSHRRD